MGTVFLILFATPPKLIVEADGSQHHN
ncbi:endonuclease domain-containing protein, partial [Kingella kingae]